MPASEFTPARMGDHRHLPFHQRFHIDRSDPTSDKNLAQDFAEWTSFWVAPDPGEIVHLKYMHIHYGDAGSFDEEKYGNNITIDPSDGIQIWLHSIDLDEIHGGPLLITDETNIHRNVDWRNVMDEVGIHSAGSGDSFLDGKWTLEGIMSEYLRGDKQEALELRIKGDFSPLNEQHAYVSGVYLNAGGTY